MSFDSSQSSAHFDASFRLQPPRPAPIPWTGRLGVPYQGSKNAIARRLLDALPSGARFVDLFAGGCAMTHAAILSRRYRRFLANDLHGFGVRLFRDALAGKCNDAWKRWVSREEFMAKRDSVPLVALCWSFGNNMVQYLYGAEIEETKRRMTIARVTGASRAEAARIAGAPDPRLQSYEACFAVAGLRFLEEAMATTSDGGVLNRLKCSFASYRDYDAVRRKGDVVYCDIPYRDSTEAYRFMRRRGMGFDHADFYDWVLTRDYPVYISEYSMPSSDFVAILELGKPAMFKARGDGTRGRRTERLYVARRFA